MLAGNVPKLNLFSALKMMLFPMAIITVFWQDHIGLSLAEILLVNVFSSGVNLLMEYPSGYVSDRLGYRRALIIACVFGIAGWSVYLQAGSVWHVVGAGIVTQAAGPHRRPAQPVRGRAGADRCPLHRGDQPRRTLQGARRRLAVRREA